MGNRDAPNGKEIEKDSSINETWDREVAVTRMLVEFWLISDHKNIEINEICYSRLVMFS